MTSRERKYLKRSYGFRVRYYSKSEYDCEGLKNVTHDEPGLFTNFAMMIPTGSSKPIKEPIFSFDTSKINPKNIIRL